MQVNFFSKVLYLFFQKKDSLQHLPVHLTPHKGANPALLILLAPTLKKNILIPGGYLSQVSGNTLSQEFSYHVCLIQSRKQKLKLL